MIIAAEVTSVLEILFVLALIKKKYKNENNLSIDFLLLNNYVNERTIKLVKNLLIGYEYPLRYFYYRNNNSKLMLENKACYEALILRTRIPINSNNRFIFYRQYFKYTMDYKICADFYLFKIFDSLFKRVIKMLLPNNVTNTIIKIMWKLKK